MSTSDALHIADENRRTEPAPLAGEPLTLSPLHPPPLHRSLLPFAVVALLAIHAGLLAWQAYRYSPTIDEPAHLAAGISHWKFGRFDLYRVNPPLVRLVAALPMLVIEPKVDWSAFTEAPYSRPEFSIGTAFANGNGFDIFWYFTLARWVCIPFSLVGGFFCYRWASDLYGPLSGLMALALWCFCPNVLGNGALITPDVAATSFGLMAAYHFWRWLRAPGWLSAAFAGLALGLALLTKSTWIVLFGVWPALWLVWAVSGYRLQTAGSRRSTAAEPPALPVACSPKPAASSAGMLNAARVPQRRVACSLKSVASSAAQLAAFLTLALYLLNLGYGFENSFQRLDKFQFISQSLGGPDAHEAPGNRFANTALAALPVPVPANYLLGIDVQKYDFEKKKWSYLRGEQKLGGWWYYYLYAMAVKMPAGTLVLLALTAIITFARTALRALPPFARGGQGGSARAVILPSDAQQESEPQKRELQRTELQRTELQRTEISGQGAGKNPQSPFTPPSTDFQPSPLPTLQPSTSLLDTFILLTPAIVVLVLVSSQTGFNRYLRYVLPAFPFLYIWVSQLARLLRPRSTGRTNPAAGDGQLGMTTVIAALTVNVVSSLAVFPHDLAYFNELVGGPMNGPAHLLDANVDWGQDLLRLKGWCESCPAATPFHLAYFGFTRPEAAGIRFAPVPRDGTNRNISPGWYAISVNELFGYRHFGETADVHAWLRQLKPVSRVGYSLQIFCVAPGSAGRAAG